MSKRLNILFILTDDQRFDTVNALGNKEIITPNMNRLVEKGTVFTHAYIPGGTCPAVCIPSRAMIHTGRTLFHIEEDGSKLSNNYELLGETLKRIGYYTYGVGKWHNDINSYVRSFTNGAAIFFGGMWDHWNVPTCEFDPTGRYENVINFTPNFFFSNKTIKVHCDKFSTGRHSTELITDVIIDFITHYDSEQPFFAYVAYLAPHDPRTMPQRFIDMYDSRQIELPKNFMKEHPFDYGIREIRDELLSPYPRTEEVIKKHIIEYYAMISHLDYGIGRILEALDKTGKIDDTIIILTGDNGLALGQHGLMGKQSVYEHSVRVPLIFTGPDIPKGLKIDNFVYLLDIYPTLCELLRIEVPSSVEGKSFASMFSNPNIKTRSTIYLAYTDLIRGIRDQKYKLIEYRGYNTITQLFDLENDPWEINNLSTRKEYVEVMTKLRQEMEKTRDEWGDELHPLGRKFWSYYRNVIL
ncbi:MAG: sulfatase-like hydrolase/transferase [bacterium]